MHPKKPYPTQLPTSVGIAADNCRRLAGVLNINDNYPGLLVETWMNQLYFTCDRNFTAPVASPKYDER
jgi:hypothetical protein